MLTLTYKIKSKTVKIGNFDTLEEAQRAYIRAREESGLGASQFGSGFVHDNGTDVARISYNGRAWPPEEWTMDTKPLAEVPATESRFSGIL